MLKILLSKTVTVTNIGEDYVYGILYTQLEDQEDIIR